VCNVIKKIYNNNITQAYYASIQSASTIMLTLILSLNGAFIQILIFGFFKYIWWLLYNIYIYIFSKYYDFFVPFQACSVLMQTFFKFEFTFSSCTFFFIIFAIGFWRNHYIINYYYTSSNKPYHIDNELTDRILQIFSQKTTRISMHFYCIVFKIKSPLIYPFGHHICEGDG